MPFFSIIMPVYNAVNFLEIAIQSVLNQSYSDFELILIDDGSTDGSSLVCDQFSARDNRVKVFHQNNHGICFTRNEGLKHSVGSYIGFMDNDDVVDSKMLEKCHEYLVKEDLDWIKFGKIEVLKNESGQVLRVQNDNVESKLYEGKEILNNLLKLRAKGRMTYVWDGFVKAEIIKSNRLLFDLHFSSGNEDIDLCEQIAYYGKRLLYINENFYTHFTYMGSSSSTKYSPKKLESYLYLLKKSNKRYEEYGIDYKNNKYYQYMITKQIILNICQKLNDAGNALTEKEKIAYLYKVKQEKVMKVYNAMDPKKIRGDSFKLYLYNNLYIYNKFGLLLKLDKYSRKIVNTLRKKGRVFYG